MSDASMRHETCSACGESVPEYDIGDMGYTLLLCGACEFNDDEAEYFEERAAIAEQDGGMKVGEAERFALASLLDRRA